jgi:hypothetical protein
LPTLEWVVTGKQWVGDEYEGEEYEVGEYRCRLCGEPVEPKKKVVYQPPVLGPTTITITINEDKFFLTEDQYAEAIDRWKEILEKVR